MDFIEVSGKSLEDAITEACNKLSVSSEHLEYEIVDLGTSGFLGFNSKPTIIKAKVKDGFEPAKEEKKDNVVDNIDPSSLVVENVPAASNVDFGDIDSIKSKVDKFLVDVFNAMKMSVETKIDFDAEESTLNIDIEGTDMGILIGKRGQTLDSLQYLISLIVNKGNGNYIRVKVDTENYRARRQKTLENLAKNLSFKVKRTKRPVSLEPMNPYERRIIHSALQNDRYVTTHSEGEEPFRRVVISLKK
ncbi:RNA-binding cell elongation regulator Jag/EloR [Lachnospiraceae bacterium C1.1]|nr:RNA-binding cell elongation regulator Jag/EloR [Lachnospiraceae bacterium C1.1]